MDTGREAVRDMSNHPLTLRHEIRRLKKLIDSYLRGCRCVESTGICCKNCSEAEKIPNAPGSYAKENN